MTTQIREPFGSAVDLEPTPDLRGLSRLTPQGSNASYWCNCSPAFACPEHR